MKKVAVVGAGPAGLVSLKYCIANGYECDVYEQRADLGGTWYENTRDDNQNENLGYAKLYQGLLTNIPKEIMMYPDYLYPPDQDKSYLNTDEVFNYFKGYADTFQLHPHIKYHTVVLNITTNVNNTWSITVKNLNTKIVETLVYNYVFVCNGHLWDPFIPEILGHYMFKGTTIHSSKYKESGAYKNKIVVVVGSLSSARDIASFISLVAKHVFVSYRGFSIVTFKDNVSAKPPIKKFSEHSVVFEDDTEEYVDDVVYCTGYNYKIPFLSNDCDITVNDRHVYPIYLHIVNIHHPTMYFIGIPLLVCAIPMFDLQVRFCIAIMNGTFKLPTKTFMLEKLNKEIIKKYELNIPKKNMHRMAEYQEDYWKELADTASITPLPPAMCRLYEKVRKERNLQLRFKIIDDENFEIY